MGKETRTSSTTPHWATVTSVTRTKKAEPGVSGPSANDTLCSVTAPQCLLKVRETKFLLFMFCEFRILCWSSLNSSGRKNTCLQLVFNISFPTLLVKTGTWDRKSQFSAATPIFYCPYVLRERGRPERPVPSHHFQSPHRGLRASAWSSEVRMCPLAVTVLPYGCPPNSSEHTHTPSSGKGACPASFQAPGVRAGSSCTCVRFPSECAGLKP